MQAQEKSISATLARGGTKPYDGGTQHAKPSPLKGSTFLDLALIFAVCLAAFFFKLGDHGVIDPGDGYYTETAREMVDTGDYVTPQLNYQMYFSKPVLIYWLIASAYHVFGVSEFAARFWSATFAMLLVGFTYWATKALAGRRAGLLSGLVLMSAPTIATYARFAQIDMMFSSLLGIALCALVMMLAVGARKWWLLFYSVLGLSILTKGPAGLVFFALTGLTYLAVRRPGKAEFFDLIKQLHLVAGPLVMLAVAAPWFICVGLATNWLWPRVFFLFENFGRFNGETNYAAPKLWFYLPVLAYSFVPWVTLLPPALRNAFARPTGLSEEQERLQKGLAIFGCWAVAVFVFMSISKTQLAYYTLPMYTGCAAVVGLLLDRWITEYQLDAKISRWHAAVSMILAPLGVVAGVAGVVYLYRYPVLFSESRAMGYAGCAVLATGLIVQCVFLCRKQVEKGIWALLATCVIATGLAAPVGVEICWRSTTGDLYDLLNRTVGTSAPVVFYRNFNPSAMFYLRRPIDFLFEPRLFIKADKLSGGMTYRSYVFVQDQHVKELTDRYADRMTLVDKSGKWNKFEMRRLIAHRQEELWVLYSYCYDALVKDKSKYGPVGVPYAAGVPKHHHVSWAKGRLVHWVTSN